MQHIHRSNYDSQKIMNLLSPKEAKDYSRRDFNYISDV
jgi:hypothetical protein